MPWLILAALGVAGFLFYRSQSSSGPPPNSGISSAQDDEIRKTVAYALANSHDSAELADLANKLEAAGYHDLAQQCAARARQISGAPNSPVSMPVAIPVMPGSVPMVTQVAVPSIPQPTGGVKATHLHITSGGYIHIPQTPISRAAAAHTMHLPGYRNGKYDIQ